MLIRSLIVTSLFCLCTLSYAEKCPSITEIKHNQFNSWQPLDINSADPISTQRLKKFTQKATQLTLAEWMDEAPEGPGHCYYRGASNTDYLDVFLAKQHVKPDTQSSQWQRFDSDTMQCNPLANSCQFIPA